MGLKFIPENDQRLRILPNFCCIDLPSAWRLRVVEIRAGWELIPGSILSLRLATNPVRRMRAIEVIGSISCVLLGAYPMVLLLTAGLKPMSVGKVLKMNNIAAAGMGGNVGRQYPDVRHDEADGYPRQSHQLRLRRFRCVRPWRPLRVLRCCQ